MRSKPGGRVTDGAVPGGNLILPDDDLGGGLGSTPVPGGGHLFVPPGGGQGGFLAPPAAHPDGGLS